MSDDVQIQIDQIIDKLNQIQVVINNLATKAQLNQISYIRQTEIDDLQTRVTNLESEIAVLQNS
jgi:polyhydroxyalkanoate synthesis regulator phasin